MFGDREDSTLCDSVVAQLRCSLNRTQSCDPCIEYTASPLAESNPVSLTFSPGVHFNLCFEWPHTCAWRKVGTKSGRGTQGFRQINLLLWLIITVNFRQKSYQWVFQRKWLEKVHTTHMCLSQII